MTTITLSTIVEHLATTIAALVPTATPAAPGFRRSTAPHRVPLRRWVPDAGENVMFRLFEIRRPGGREDLGVLDPTAALISMPLVVTVCYPANPKLYGLAEFYHLEALIESDTRQIRDAIFLPSSGLAGAGHQANFIGSTSLDQADEKVWWSDINVEAVFYIAQ